MERKAKKASPNRVSRGDSTASRNPLITEDSV